MSNNNDNSGTLLVAFAVAAIAAAVMFFYALAAFVTVVLTIIAFCGWFKPLTLFGSTIYPHEARAFVRNGVIGTILTPLFVIFAANLLEFRINEEMWPHVFIIGYILGSLGIEFLKDDEDRQTVLPMKEINPDSSRLPPPEEKKAPTPEPFRFAEWDEED